jgi:hypothetical protein
MSYVRGLGDASLTADQYLVAKALGWSNLSDGANGTGIDSNPNVTAANLTTISSTIAYLAQSGLTPSTATQAQITAAFMAVSNPPVAAVTPPVAAVTPPVAAVTSALMPASAAVTQSAQVQMIPVPATVTAPAATASSGFLSSTWLGLPAWLWLVAAGGGALLFMENR